MPADLDYLLAKVSDAEVGSPEFQALVTLVAARETREQTQAIEALTDALRGRRDVPEPLALSNGAVRPGKSKTRKE